MIEFVNVGPNGTFEASGNHVTTVAEVDALFDALEASDRSALVLHFHGGLVDEAAGVGVAHKMVPVYRDAGCHPLTFVWETGLVETFRENLTKIHHTRLFRKLLKWVLKRVAQRFGGLGGRGAGVPVPMADIDAQLDKDEPFSDYDDPRTGKGAARGGAPAVEEEDLEHLRAELQAEFEQDVSGDFEVDELLREHGEQEIDAGARGIISAVKTAKFLAAVAYRVIRRHVRGRDHGFYPTVVEELLRELYLADLGAWVWTRMKDKAADMWLPNDHRSGEELRAGTYVLERIAALQARRPAFTLDLVGHSAGSIAICEMLRAAAARGTEVKVRWIVFLAPAGRSELGVAEIVRHPERYQKFRSYTMADEYERTDALASKLYPRSLLYFISGVLEPDEVDAPIMGMMRHAGGQAPFEDGPAAEWSTFIAEPQRLVLSDSTVLDPSAPPGRRSSSRKHGDFDDDDPTRESLTTTLGN